jgi:MFS family permease
MTYARGLLIDRVPLQLFVTSVGIGAALSCLAIALSPTWWIFLFALTLVRLFGLGLMLHAVNIATLRFFPAASASAFALLGLGSSAAQTVIPLLVVSSIQTVGWRASWAIAAITCVAVTALAAQLVSKRISHADTLERVALNERRAWRHPKLGKVAMALLLVPSLYTVSVVLTGLLIHQQSLAADKGWSAAYIAGSLSVFALCQAAVSLVFAPYVDRIGAIKLLPLLLMPLILAMLLYVFSDSIIVGVAFFGLLGISAGLDTLLNATIWRDLLGFDRVAAVRSLVEGTRIILVGLAPVIIGWLLDGGVTMSIVCGGMALLAALATALTALVSLTFEHLEPV